MKQKPSPTSGRARAVLVYGDGDSALGVICWLSVRAEPIPDEAAEDLVQVDGPVTIDASADHQLQQVVAPSVNEVLRGLDLAPCRYHLSVTNIDAVAAHDLPAAIEGFSADAPAWLAMLSAALGLPLDPTTVVTGHLASTGGDIGAVSHLGAKQLAVSRIATASGVKRLLHPQQNLDGSLAALSPQQHDDDARLAAQAGLNLATEAVSGVDILLARMVNEADLVQSALERGFYGTASQTETHGGPLDRAVAWLRGDHHARFWKALETACFSGAGGEIKKLLQQYVNHHHAGGAYPHRFGNELYHQVASLPPAVSRIKLSFPLIPRRQCLALAPLVASEAEADDLRLLLNAVTGNFRREESRGSSAANPQVGETNLPVSDASLRLVDTTLETISSDALTHQVRKYIDAAHNSFRLTETFCDDHTAFLETIESFCYHLLRYTAVDVQDAASQWISAQALDLVERAFRDEDGLTGAEAEARHGTRGGLRFVLQRMADQLKHEREVMVVNRVLKETVDPLSPTKRIEFMRALMQRIGHHLPEDVRNQPPEYLANQHERFARAYVRAIDGVVSTFRSVIG
jgi:hypothetical protein